MAAGALLFQKNHRTRMRSYATRGPGNIDGLPRGRKIVPRSKRLAKRKGAKA